LCATVRRVSMASVVIRSVLAAFFLLIPGVALAQAPEPAPQPNLLKPEELDQLLAPIALYPDPLLAEVLMASAYPLDIVQAERWLKSHKNLKGDQLKAALAKEDWDDSIKSLVATPDVLAMMNDKIDWTEKLGDAVVAQQPDVMDAIQRLRSKAQANDKLTTTKQQKVTVNQVQGKQVIAIEPTDPDTMYVPYYDPSVVYGPWPYPASRPITGRRRPISATACLRPDLPSAPAGRWAIGGREVIGAAASTGAAAVITSISAGDGRDIQLPAAATDGGRASIIGKAPANVISAAAAVSKCSGLATNPAIDPVPAIGRARGPAPSPAADAPMSANAIVRARVPEPRIAAGNAQAPRAGLRTAGQPRAIAPGAAGLQTSAAVAVGAAACAHAAAAVVAAAASVVAAVGVAVAGAAAGVGAPTSCSSMTSFFSAI